LRRQPPPPKAARWSPPAAGPTLGARWAHSRLPPGGALRPPTPGGGPSRPATRPGPELRPRQPPRPPPGGTAGEAGEVPRRYRETPHRPRARPNGRGRPKGLAIRPRPRSLGPAWRVPPWSAPRRWPRRWRAGPPTHSPSPRGAGRPPGGGRGGGGWGSGWAGAVDRTPETFLVRGRSNGDPEAPARQSSDPGRQRAARPLAGRGPSLGVRASSASPSPDPFPGARGRFKGPHPSGANHRLRR